MKVEGCWVIPGLGACSYQGFRFLRYVLGVVRFLGPEFGVPGFRGPGPLGWGFRVLRL